MDGLKNLLWVRSRLLWNSARQFLAGSKLRLTVILSMGLGFWGLLFLLFWRGFVFLHQFSGLRDILVDYLFSFLFLALMAMMAISNAIISYTALFNSQEADFLLSLPCRRETVFLYKSAQSLVFSSWGLVTMAGPLVLAYGLTTAAPWYFYVIAFFSAALFSLLPTEIGAAIAVLIGLVAPRRRKLMFLLAAVISLSIGGWWVWSLVQQAPALFSEAGLQQIMGKLSFSQHWALPSQWVSRCMLSASRGRITDSLFLLTLLLSNVMFLGVVVQWLGRTLYAPARVRAQNRESGGARSHFGVLDRTLYSLLKPLPRNLRWLILKDVKSFRRDPAQWSQGLLFFGLLGLYIANLPRFELTDAGAYWDNLVSVLNLMATCLTLSTLTSRFVFPQLSLEGRRIWIVGMLPMPRPTILWGKFAFSFLGSLIVSGSLILLSDYLLNINLQTTLIHAVIVVCVCGGLNGLAVGLGAVYPDLSTDDPSKIISSFGGTLNLICSITFILVVVVPISIILHLNAVGTLTGPPYVIAIAVGLFLVLVVSGLTLYIPMWAGIRAIRRMQF